MGVRTRVFLTGVLASSTKTDVTIEVFLLCSASPAPAKTCPGFRSVFHGEIQPIWGGGPLIDLSSIKNHAVLQGKKPKVLTGRRWWTIRCNVDSYNDFQKAWWATWVPTGVGAGAKPSIAPTAADFASHCRAVVMAQRMLKHWRARRGVSESICLSACQSVCLPACSCYVMLCYVCDVSSLAMMGGCHPCTVARGGGN